MRIGVLVFEQAEIDSPEHFVSRSMRDKFLSYRRNGKLAVKRISEHVIKIVIPVTFQKLKSLFRQYERDSAPRYNPSGPFIPEHLPANIDAQLGVLVQIPALPNQVRYRHF